jgi:uncharacterized membrane protein
VIYGLLAALGWGLSDFNGAVAGRRIGSLATVLTGQFLSAAFMTVIVVATGQDFGRIGPWIGLVAANGLFTAAAYFGHYRALQLGPVAVVSPIGAAYAVVAIVLAMLFLGERPGSLALTGAVLTVLGVALVSADLRALRAGLQARAPGVWWSLVSAIGFGVAAFMLGKAAIELGWVLGLWASRVAQITCYLPLIVAGRRELRRVPSAEGALVGIAFALAAGASDILGVTTYSAGAEAGFVSIVVAASAIYPGIAVALSMGFLHERLVTNQWIGVGLVLMGLLVLGLGAR